jgi:hypothetical protein
MGIVAQFPPGFPEKAFAAIHTTTGRWLAATRQGDKPPLVHFEFAGAWNAVGYRALVSLTQQVFGEVERELRLAGFWESIPARNGPRLPRPSSRERQ